MLCRRERESCETLKTTFRSTHTAHNICTRVVLLLLSLLLLLLLLLSVLLPHLAYLFQSPFLQVTTPQC
jgi:hypothetical protein